MYIYIYIYISQPLTCYTLLVKTSKPKFTDVIFPFQGINNKILSSIFSEYPVNNRKLKCHDCNKRIQVGTPLTHCCECQYYFHLKCENVNRTYLPLPSDWICLCCTMKALPFGSINDENMKLTNHGLSDESIDFVVGKCTSFTIKSLLDQMPCQQIDTDQFMSNTILSKYYTTDDFVFLKSSRFRLDKY